MPEPQIRRPPPAGARRAALALAAALGAWIAPACDNPACVFGGDCFSDDPTGGALGSNPASVPDDHAWLLPGAPVFTEFFPSGNQIATTTPVVVRFSESMSLQSLASAFQLTEVGGFGVPVPLLPPGLSGDGRLLILIPATALKSSATYELSFREDVVVFDLLGTTLQEPTNGLVGTFTVAASDPTVPRLLTTWPPDGAANQSPTGEIVAVFDRRMVATPVPTVTVDCFVVTVAGTKPVAYPAPQAVIFAGGGGFPATDTRAWSWRSVASEGLAVPLGTGSAVNLTLSPAGHKIVAEAGGDLPETQIDFDLTPFLAPLSAEIVSLPTDAIGIANLSGGVPLAVAVEISGGLSSDELGIFLFGDNQNGQGSLVALFREITLAAAGYDPLTGIATLGEAELDLASSTAPVDARFADGTLSIALRLERGGVISPVRLLDTDRSDAPPQPALLDTTRPVLLGLSGAGTNLSSLRSDLTDLVVVGRADEEVRAAEVSTALGDNGVLPPVIAFDPPQGTVDDGLFVAAPVLLGVIDPASLPLDFSLRIYDRALNGAAAPTSASFRQIGASGPAAALPGNPTVAVEVFAADGLAAVPNAHVFTHELAGGAPTYVDDAFTDPSGRVTLAAAPSGETIVTVDATGYDLFSFQGVPTARLGVPLSRANTPSATFQGTVTTVDLAVQTMTKWAADSRLTSAFGDVVTVQACSFNPIELSFDCVYGPASMAAGPLGAAGVVAVIPPPGEFAYSASGFLKAWRARLPRKLAGAGQVSLLDFALNSTLDGVGTPQEELSIDGPALDLDATGASGIDLSALNGAPRIALQARVRGLGGALLAGYGVAFPLSGAPTDTWRVRCAYPGAVDLNDTSYPSDSLGELVADGVIDAELFVRCELEDSSGNRTSRRPKASTLPPLSALAAIGVPTLNSPAAGTGTGGPAYDLSFDEVLGGTGQSGLYSAALKAAGGRRWVLWRLGGAGPTLSISLPDIATNGGSPLPNGSITARIAAFAWPAFSPQASFLWTDIGRDQDAFAQCAAVQFTQP